MPRLLIIGGSDAGIAAALRAREVAPHITVTVLVADAFPNYSICGLPFYLEQLSSSWSRPGVAGVGEPRQRISGCDGLDRHPHGFPQRLLRASSPSA